MIQDTLVADTVLTAVQQLTDGAPMSNLLPERVGFTFSLVKILRGILGMAVLLVIAWAGSPGPM